MFFLLIHNLFSELYSEGFDLSCKQKRKQNLGELPVLVLGKSESVSFCCNRILAGLFRKFVISYSKRFQWDMNWSKHLSFTICDWFPKDFNEQSSFKTDLFTQGKFNHFLCCNRKNKLKFGFVFLSNLIPCLI